MSAEVDLRKVRGFERRVAQLLVAGVRAQYELGLEIRAIKDGRFWTEWPNPPESGWPKDKTGWNVWCYHILGYRERKADYLAKNAVDLKALELGDDVLVRALRVGWYRLAEILRVCKDENTLIGWIDWVENTKPSLDEIRAAVKVAAGGEPAEPEGDDDDGEGTDSSKTEQSDPPKRVYKWPLQFEDQESQKTFVKGLNAIKRRLGDMGNGKAAALMATHYLGTLPRDDEGGVAVELDYLLEAIEATYGVKVGVVETQTVDAVGEM